MLACACMCVRVYTFVCTCSPPSEFVVCCLQFEASPLNFFPFFFFFFFLHFRNQRNMYFHRKNPLRRMERLVLFFCCFVFFKSTKTEEIEVDWFMAAFCGLLCSGSEGVHICCERDSPPSRLFSIQHLLLASQPRPPQPRAGRAR